MHHKLNVEIVVNKYDIWEPPFGTLLFYCFNFGISIVKIVNKILTFSKSFISKKARTWPLKRASG